MFDEEDDTFSGNKDTDLHSEQRDWLKVGPDWHKIWLIGSLKDQLIRVDFDFDVTSQIV